jgi:putative membrane protein
MMGEFHGGLFGFHFLWWIFWIVLAGVALWAIVRKRAPASGSTASAREILDQRYARGEINDTEYDDRRRRIEGGSDRDAI